MALLINAFEGLTELDFDVYRRECWSSNLHNLDRMKTKERVLALGRAMREAVGESRLEHSSSSEIPSVWNGRSVQDQWVYLMRPKEARKTLGPMFARQMDLETRVKDPAEHHRHALLFVRIDVAGLEAGLRLNEHATVDLANLLAKGESHTAELTALLQALPDDITISGEPPTTNRLLALARATRAGDAEWVVVSRRFEPAEAVSHGAELGAVAGGVAAALAPLYDFLEWRTDNDHFQVEETLDQVASAREARATAKAEAETAQSEAREARQVAARARTHAKVDAEAAWRDMQRKAKAKRSAEVSERPAAQPAERPGRKIEPRATGAASGSPSATQKPAAQSQAPKPAVADLKVGDKCRMTRGLLAGKEGEITAQDKKGYFKVKVGGFEVSVAEGDIESA